MRAVALTGPNQVSVIEVPDPSDESVALVRVDGSGLCGTDIKILRGQIPVQLPRVLGHEVVGRVQRAAGTIAEGTRVLVDPYACCGTCRLCKADKHHLCTNGALMGRDVDGGLTETLAIPETRLHPIPDSIDDRSARLLQVLGTCVHAQGRLATSPDMTAVVLGLGVSGLLNLQLLRDRGIERVIGVTRSVEKRELARSMGAIAAVHPDEAAATVADLTDGQGAEIVVESAGTAATLGQAITLAAPGGDILLFGVTTHAPDLPLYQIYYKELRLIGARAARGPDYAKGIELTAAKRLNLAPLWTAGFAIDQAEEALARLEKDDALKVTLEMR
jgi:(R,R)-butanediol dehydrogenase / meso-butanediol dehydrogenase / diacetyl reductase